MLPYMVFGRSAYCSLFFLRADSFLIAFVSLFQPTLLYSASGHPVYYARFGVRPDSLCSLFLPPGGWSMLLYSTFGLAAAYTISGVRPESLCS